MGPLWNPPPDGKEPTGRAWSAVAYDIALELGRGGELSFRADAELRHDGAEELEELEFTLHHLFAVTAVSGELVGSWERRGDAVRVALREGLAPGTSLRLAFTYRGRVDVWGRHLNWGLSPVAFAREDCAYLPAGIIWWPVPGRVPGPSGLVDPFVADRLFLEPAAFHVTCAVPSGSACEMPMLARVGPGEFSGVCRAPGLIIAPDVARATAEVGTGNSVVVVGPGVYRPGLDPAAREIAGWIVELCGVLDEPLPERLSFLVVDGWFSPLRGAVDPGDAVPVPWWVMGQLIEYSLRGGSAVSTWARWEPLTIFSAVVQEVLLADRPQELRRTVSNGPVDREAWEKMRREEDLIDLVRTMAVSVVADSRLGREACLAVLEWEWAPAGEAGGWATFAEPEMRAVAAEFASLCQRQGRQAVGRVVREARTLLRAGTLTLEALRQMIGAAGGEPK